MCISCDASIFAPKAAVKINAQGLRYETIDKNLLPYCLETKNYSHTHQRKPTDAKRTKEVLLFEIQMELHCKHLKMAFTFLHHFHRLVLI